MSTARDNFFKECPAVMDYSSFTDYRTSHRREQYIRSINGIVDNNDYRMFLQNNTGKILQNEWKYLQKN